MPRIIIDSREVDVPEGATVLDAARQLGIDVPTLCHAEGYRPSTSCFVCVVKLQGRAGLVPACGTVAVDGMVVESDTDDVHRARRMAVELLLSDHVGDCVGPCTIACPAGLEVAAMLRHVHAGRVPQAHEVARRCLALPGSLGRLCPRFCERACRRGDLDAPVAIGCLHRYVADAAPAHTETIPSVPESTGRRIAVVGAGPAGLAAAFYLRQKGHACTVFDQHAEPGGMFRYGVPAFRLPREILAAEIDVFRHMGVAFRMNWGLRRDGTLEQIRAEFDAVFLAIGAQRNLLPDSDASQVTWPAIDFLSRVAQGERPDVGPDVVVVGGDEITGDVVRTALRLGGERVTCLWPKGQEHTSPIACERLREAEVDGARIAFSSAVQEIAAGPADTCRVRVQDDNGDRELLASTVIAATGRSVDVALAQDLGLRTTARGVQVDRRTLATSMPGVFAGGDATRGPSHGVQAVADGRRAAESIDAYLSGRPFQGEPRVFNSTLGTLSDAERPVFYAHAHPAARAVPRAPGADPSQTGFHEVVPGLRQAEAAVEAARCLQCDCRKKDTCRLRQVATRLGARATRYRGGRRPFAREITHPDIVFEPGKCIQCGLCIQVAQRAGEALGLAMVDRGFRVQPSVPFNETLHEGLRTASHQCAAICPTGAISLAVEHQD